MAVARPERAPCGNLPRQAGPRRPDPAALGAPPAAGGARRVRAEIPSAARRAGARPGVTLDAAARARSPAAGMAGIPRIGGCAARRRVCVMFCDVHDFTPRVAGLAPEQVISLLNRHFTSATAAIYKHGGSTNKLLGDGLMALFGAPQPLECPEKNALEAAQDIL